MAPSKKSKSSKSLFASVPVRSRIESVSKRGGGGGGGSRPKTPVSPRKGSAPDSPLLVPHVSEMDVSRVDPEEALVDFETVTEEGEDKAVGTGTRSGRSSAKPSAGPPPESSGKKSARSDGDKGSTPSSAKEGKDSGSGSGTNTPATTKKKERRFIIF